MRETDLAWEPMLSSDVPDNAQLRGALFTTYDSPDERLLVEHLLPELFHLVRGPAGHGAEQQLFLVELHERLERLHDRIFVVSSTARDEVSEEEGREGSAYGWIWRSIRHLTVGSEGKAVQHAKLWMLHWDDSGQEYLELVVSSANLTLAALKAQLQAGWRVCLPLQARATQARRDSWGLLPAFIEALARSTGDAERLAAFLGLLGRAECPPGVGFIASAPGTHSRAALRSTPWGSAGLSAMAPGGRGRVTAVLLSPYVGTWSAEALETWAGAFEGTPETLHLLWIDRDHRWAPAKGWNGAGKWLLPEATLEAFDEAGVQLHRLPASTDDEAASLFHPEHRVQDPRWSHAKVYALSRGLSTRLLVTSANFSPAAWGRMGSDGTLTIENFELGVWQEGLRWPEDLPDAFDDLRDVAVVATAPARTLSAILWAEASWDGAEVLIACRCTDSLTATLEAGGKRMEIGGWKARKKANALEATVAWTDTKAIPTVVRLASGDDSICVAVFDARPVEQRETSFPPGLDPELAEQLRDELLFERYGGAVASEDDLAPEETAGAEAALHGAAAALHLAANMGEALAGNAGWEDDGPAAGLGDSYAVPVFETARRHLSVVDNWAVRVQRAAATIGSSRELELQSLRGDGERLRAAFGRQAERDQRSDVARALGAQLAQEEMTLQLEHYPED